MASPSKLQYRPRLGIYKYSARSTVTFNPETCTGTSYDWWVFVRRVRGKVVFNNHSYSVTTRAHQSGMRSLLRQLGIEVFVECDTRASLDSALTDTLEPLYLKLFQLQAEEKRRNAKPRTAQIKTVKEQIQRLRSLGAKLSRKISDMQTQISRREQARLTKGQEKRRLAEIKANMSAHVLSSPPIVETTPKSALSVVDGGAALSRRGRAKLTLILGGKS